MTCNNCGARHFMDLLSLPGICQGTHMPRGRCVSVSLAQMWAFVVVPIDGHSASGDADPCGTTQ